MILPPDPAAVERFRDAFTRQCPPGPDDLVGVAVSGGPDSLALLLLADAAFPGRIRAATVDHGLRAESAAEAAMVAAVSATLGVPHQTLRGVWDDRHGDGLQAAARRYRYRELNRWCARHSLAFLATAHHADDQAETLLMRLARGAGVGGLGSIRPVRRIIASLPGAVPGGPAPWRFHLVRPLLHFDKAVLAAIVSAAGLTAIDDPSNDDPQFDRTHARRLLADTRWLRADRLAASASHLADAEAALAWAAFAEFDRRATRSNDDDAPPEWTLDPDGLPIELLRRVVQLLCAEVEEIATGGLSEFLPSGPELSRIVSRLQSGKTATFSHVLARPGPVWRFTAAPPRRT